MLWLPVLSTLQVIRRGVAKGSPPTNPVQPRPPHRISNNSSPRLLARTSPEISRPQMRQLRHQSQERLGIPPPRLAHQLGEQRVQKAALHGSSKLTVGSQTASFTTPQA